MSDSSWPAASARMHRIRRFFVQLAEAAHRRGLLAQAASLSWVTTLSLVPLLAAFSFVGARFFDSHRERILEAIGAFVPWPEAAVLERLESLVAEAESVREIGALSFLIVTLGLFDAVEKSVNRLWGISKQRPLKRRLGSLAQLLFWGPIVIGVGVSSLAEIQVRGITWFPAGLLLSSLVFGSLVMLYRGVPATRVQPRAAFAGAAVATVLIEVLRQGFGSYTEWWLNAGPNVYGSLALVVLFLLSIHLAWLALLLGALSAAVVQRGPIATGAPRANPWVGLTTLLLLSQRLLKKQPPLAAEALPLEIGCDADELDATIKVLATAGLVHYDEESSLLVLTASPFLVSADEVLALFPETTIEPQGAEIQTALSEAVAKAIEHRPEHLGQLTLAGLLGAAESNSDLAPTASSG